MAITYFVCSPPTYFAVGLSSDTKPSSPPDNCTFREADSGRFYTSINGLWIMPVGNFYDPTTATLATERFLLQYQHLKLSTSERLTVAGTARVKLSDFGDADSVIVGTPQLSRTNFTIPDNYVLDLISRMILTMRATIQGLGRLVLTDDFGTRSRIVLAGRG